MQQLTHHLHTRNWHVYTCKMYSERWAC